MFLSSIDYILIKHYLKILCLAALFHRRLLTNALAGRSETSISILFVLYSLFFNAFVKLVFSSKMHDSLLHSRREAVIHHQNVNIDYYLIVSVTN